MTYELFLRAANDLRTRSHREQLADTIARRTRALAFRQHAFTHDRDGFWLAEATGQAVGFGIATARPDFWHLNALHVLPGFQAKGVGRTLLHRCMEYGRGPEVVSTVISEASQPISNALYASHGMYQWLPLVHIQCPTFPADLRPSGGAAAPRPGKPDAPTLAALDSIDQAVLGFMRGVDHRFWIELEDQSLLLMVARDEPVGYAYVSRFGGIGPCATRSTRYLPSLLDHSVRWAAEHGVQRASFVVPGLASASLRYLLERGGQYEADMTVLLTSKPFGRMDHYLLPANDALF